MRVCCIGVGRWGRNIVRVLARLRDQGDIEDLAICDIDISRARELAKRYLVSEVYSNIDEIKHSKYDAYIVAVPTKYHYVVVKKLLPYSHVFVEKPIATTIEEARELVLEAKKQGRILMVGHIVRFEPVVSHLLNILSRLRSEGEEVVNIYGVRIGPGPFNPVYTLNLGVAHDLLVHDIDICNYVLNELPREVVAKTRYVSNFPYEVDIVANYTYPSGTVAQLRASWLCSQTMKRRLMEIQTMNYVITVDYMLQRVVKEKGIASYTSNSDYTSLVLSYQSKEISEERLLLGPHNEPLLVELKHFIECVKSGREPLTSGVVGYIALKCVVYALKSAEKGMRVEIPWNEDFI